MLRHAVAGDIVAIERVAAGSDGEIDAGAQGFRLVAMRVVETGQMIAGDVVGCAANHEGVEKLFGAGVARHFAIIETFEREAAAGDFVEAVVANRGMVHTA